MAGQGETLPEIITIRMNRQSDMNVTIADHIRRERQRLRRHRTDIFKQQRKLENQLAALDRELDVLEAREADRRTPSIANYLECWLWGH